MTIQAQQDFSKYKWRNRILVFSSPSLSNEVFKDQLDSFLSTPKKLDDRNLLIFILVKGRIYDHNLNSVSHFDVSAVRKKLNMPVSYEGLILIGKDGASKLKKEYPVDPKQIYEAIDQMPMRQKEMRENIDD